MAALAPIGVFVRFAIAAAATAYSNWDTIQSTWTRASEEPDQHIFGYYLQNVFEFQDFSGTFSARERGMWGVHYVNSTAGEPDYTWVTADFTAVESAWTTFWTTVAANISSQCRYVEQRWYPFGPGVVPPNPPTRVVTLTPLAGSNSAGAGVRQVATNITLRTGLRRHWGRIYMPTTSAAYNPSGRLSSAICDNWCNAARTCFMTPSTSQGVVPVVYDRTRRGMFGITEIEVDDVPDIQRRRRARQTGYKKVLSS